MALSRLGIDQSVDFEIDSAIDLQINTQLSMCIASPGEVGAGLRGLSSAEREVMQVEGSGATKGSLAWEVCRAGEPRAGQALGWPGQHVDTIQ